MWEKARAGRFERTALKHVYYHIASSMHEAGHSKLCSGTTQTDGVGRELGGEFRMRGHMYTRG